MVGEGEGTPVTISWRRIAPVYSPHQSAKAMSWRVRPAENTASGFRPAVAFLPVLAVGVGRRLIAVGRSSPPLPWAPIPWKSLARGVGRVTIFVPETPP